MSRIISRAALVASVIIISACTQRPAHVEMRGQEVFSRDYNRSNKSNRDYSRYQPPAVRTTGNPDNVISHETFVSEPTLQNAEYSSVGVTDLAPPIATTTPSPTAPQTRPVNLIAPSPVPQAAPQSLNPWTGRVRMMESVKETEEPLSVLDNTMQKKNAAANAPVTATTAKFIWPVQSSKVIASFGPKSNGVKNDGITIAAPGGEPVWASADGEVVYVGDELRSYGNMVIIKHNGGKTTSYAHLNRSNVEKYDRVKQGDIIGFVGSSGNAPKSQLYFSMRQGNDPIDPTKVLSKNVAGL